MYSRVPNIIFTMVFVFVCIYLLFCSLTHYIYIYTCLKLFFMYFHKFLLWYVVIFFHLLTCLKVNTSIYNKFLLSIMCVHWIFSLQLYFIMDIILCMDIHSSEGNCFLWCVSYHIYVCVKIYVCTWLTT